MFYLHALTKTDFIFLWGGVIVVYFIGAYTYTKVKEQKGKGKEPIEEKPIPIQEEPPVRVDPLENLIINSQLEENKPTPAVDLPVNLGKYVAPNTGEQTQIETNREPEPETIFNQANSASAEEAEEEEEENVAGYGAGGYGRFMKPVQDIGQTTSLEENTLSGHDNDEELEDDTAPHVAEKETDFLGQILQDGKDKKKRDLLKNDITGQEIMQYYLNKNKKN